MSTMATEIMLLHRDLKAYYANMGFMDGSTPAEFLARVILPSQRNAIPQDPDNPQGSPSAIAAASAGDAETSLD